jgi:hypothetical protein
VCGDQLTTEVVVRGSGFSPVAIDLPNAPRVALPGVRLTRKHELDGSAAGNPDEVFWSGDPEADPTNAYGDGEDDPLLSWQSQQQLTFVVHQELVLERGGSGRLPAGVYDVTVENGNGSAGTSPASLAVVDRPAVESLEPTILCLEQGGRTLALTGSSFVEIEGEGPVLEAGDAATTAMRW